MMIKQGDIFWINLRRPKGSEPGYRRPHVVVQNDVFNASRINTVVVCALTSKLKHANAPGNVVLQKKEANLKEKSVVNISQMITFNKMELNEKIGSLSQEKTKKIIEGIKLLIEPLPDPKL
jgi:mRNA interferase MazF